MAEDIRAAFADLYATYHRRLRGFAVTVLGATDADDLVQDAMLRAYASYRSLDPDRDPWPWLVAILRNVARDRWAARGAIPVESVLQAGADETDDVDERHVVRAALDRLSASDRDVLVLRECHDLSFGELASLLGRSPNALRQQVFRARRRLAAAYTAIGGRAVGVAAWLRRHWPAPAEQVAAAVVAGAIAVNAPAPARDVPQPGPAVVVAGPVAREDAPAGPATVRTARDRPLPPAPTVRLAPPRPAPTPTAPPRPSKRIASDGTGAQQGKSPVPDEPVLCAVTPAC